MRKRVGEKLRSIPPPHPPRPRSPRVERETTEGTHPLYLSHVTSTEVASASTQKPTRALKAAFPTRPAMRNPTMTTLDLSLKPRAIHLVGPIGVRSPAGLVLVSRRQSDLPLKIFNFHHCLTINIHTLAFSTHTSSITHETHHVSEHTRRRHLISTGCNDIHIIVMAGQFFQHEASSCLWSTPPPLVMPRGKRPRTTAPDSVHEPPQPQISLTRTEHIVCS